MLVFTPEALPRVIFMILRRAPTLNLPNQLTVLRLGMCGLLLISLSFTWSYAATTAFIIFVLASLTDCLMARSRDRAAWLPILANCSIRSPTKSLSPARWLPWSSAHVAPMWMVVVIIAREFLITGLRTIAAHKQKILAAERVGKHKTISQIVVVLDSLACLSLAEFGLQQTRLAHVLSAAQIWLYWFALILTVYSGATYFWKNAAILNDSLSDPPEPVRPHLEPLEMKTAEAPPAPPVSFAFKEWGAIVAALGQGAQIIILRKGGIAEGRAGFQARHSRFWLFPTGFHQQAEKTLPELRRYFPPTSASSSEIALTYFAEVTDALYLSTWDQVERLRGTHFWGEEILRERFGYQDRPGMEAGLHLLIVRVFRVNLPHLLQPSPAYEGCKSWIEVPVDGSRDLAVPVIADEEFATRRSQILAAAGARSIAA